MCSRALCSGCSRAAQTWSSISCWRESSTQEWLQHCSEFLKACPCRSLLLSYVLYTCPGHILQHCLLRILNACIIPHLRMCRQCCMDNFFAFYDSYFHFPLTALHYSTFTFQRHYCTLNFTFSSTSPLPLHVTIYLLLFNCILQHCIFTFSISTPPPHSLHFTILVLLFYCILQRSDKMPSYSEPTMHHSLCITTVFI